MFFKTALVASVAGLAAALPHTRRQNTAGGGVTIVNNIGSDVYAWSVSDRVSNMETLSAGGGSYTSSWQTNDNGGGISIKLSTSQSQADVLQFEYTQSGDTIFWDMSSINLSPDSDFVKYGFSVVPSSGGGNCPTVTCSAGNTNCQEAYQQPDDNHATHGCPIDTSFTLTLG
ncbi:putative extracellular thaumatin domain protein, partial [Aspergillus brunneoviolaceus CBS 621.78]